MPSQISHTFLDLSQSEALQKGRFQDFVKEVLRVLSTELKVERTSFWLFKENKEAFENVCRYDARKGQFGRQHAIWEKDFPKYYHLLQSSDLIKVPNVNEEIRISELLDDYLIQDEVHSMIGRQVWYGGRLLGFVLVEQMSHYRDWGNAEEMQLQIAVSYLIQAYNSKKWLAKYHPEKMGNGDLSSLVDKEKEEMRRKLTDHAFYTSHNIRHPVTTIMALMELIKTSWEDREVYETLMTQLQIEVMNLDETIRVMSAKIELD